MMAAVREVFRPPAGMEVDFAAPPGEPALAPRDGVSWRIFANPVSLFVGGVAAVLLELAEPSVRSGVWDHSSFRRDPGLRLRRTGFAAMMTVYGPRSKAQEMIARVVAMHDRVRGATPDGEPYHANDPRLLDWVQATATFGFAQAYHRYVRRLSAEEWDAAFAEGAPAAALYGATGAPRSQAEWDRLLSETAPRLEGSDILREFLDIMSQAPILPGPARLLQARLVRAAVAITPAPVRALPQLAGRGLRAGEALQIKAMARAAGIVTLPGTPPAQAARRLAAA